jgi:hypothetical protein
MAWQPVRRHRWADDAVTRSFAIITTDASPDVAKRHDVPHVLPFRSHQPTSIRLRFWFGSHGATYECPWRRFQ